MIVVLQGQESFTISSYTNLYEKIIPKDNFLRRLNDIVDFNFILDELKNKYCHDNGRNAIPPIQMFKYLLLKRIFDLSDVDVIERARYDMSFKYFLRLAPEDSVIEPSSLTKFRKLRLEDINLLDLLVNKTVEIAVEHGIIESKTIIVDATHTSSRYCATSADEFLKEKAKQVRKTVYQFDETMKAKFPEKPVRNDVKETTKYCEELIDIVDQSDLKGLPAVKEKMNYLNEVLDDCKDQTALSNDPDARIGYKTADSSFFGYKTHLALTKERIITAAAITTGEKNDGKYLEELVHKSKEAGMEIDTVVGDTAYSGTDNLKFAKEESFQLVSKLHPVITNGKQRDSGFEFNKDADMFVCPAGHLATKKLTKKRNDSRNTQIKYYFDVGKCKVCPLRDGCYKEGAKTKTYSVTVKSTEHEKQEAFQQGEIFKELAKDRYMIEAKNSELKNRHGYDQATDSGLFGMEIQGATTIFAANLKRIIKLIDKKA